MGNVLSGPRGRALVVSLAVAIVALVWRRRRVPALAPCTPQAVTGVLASRPTIVPPRQSLPSTPQIISPQPPRPVPRVRSTEADAVEVWICLDFEWTCDDGPSETRKVRADNVEIIEFAYVVYDAKHKRMAREGQHFCKNVKTPITEFCTTLTGISEATLANAGSLADALAKLEADMQAPELVGRPSCAVAHGCADLELVLPQHCKALGLEIPTCLHKYVDLRLAAQRHVFDTGERCSRVSSLKQICEALGVEMLGEEHCGLDDSWLVLMATQKLLLAGANLHPIHHVAEKTKFYSGENCDSTLCIDGLPFVALRAEVVNFLEASAGVTPKNVSIVVGMDGRPSGRAVADFGSHELAAKALLAFEGGRLFVCGDSPDTNIERLLLLRPLRVDETELPVWDQIHDRGGPAIAPFPAQAEELRRARGFCFAFQRGDCFRGESCPYLHKLREVGDKLPCFQFRKGQCTRGETCRFSHS